MTTDKQADRCPNCGKFTMNANGDKDDYYYAAADPRRYSDTEREAGDIVPYCNAGCYSRRCDKLGVPQHKEVTK